MYLRLTCYGETYDLAQTFAEARELTWRHVWTCPEGPMPWARPVEFHRELAGWAAYGGPTHERLNHNVVEVTGDE